MVILENTDRVGAKHIAKLLCESVKELLVSVGKGSWPGSVSIGVASKKEDMQEMEDLIQMADKGVYLAKEAGRGCVKNACSGSNIPKTPLVN